MPTSDPPVRKKPSLAPRGARYTMLRIALATTACVLLGAGTTTGAPSSTASTKQASYRQLQALARDITFGWAKLHPLVATQLGIAGENGLLDTPSLAEDNRDLALIRTWEARLAAIPLAGASLQIRDDAVLLHAQLVNMERQYTVYESDRKDYSSPGVTIITAIYTQFMHLPRAGRGRAWADITARLAHAPAYIAAGETLVTEPGHLQSVTGAEELAGAPDLLGDALTRAAKAQLGQAAFVRFAAARDATLAAIAREKTYIAAHAADWPENFAMGRAAYDALLKDEELLPYDTGAVERMGADELAHGWAVTYWVRHLATERGTPIGPATGGGLAPGGPALISYYRAQIAHLREFVSTQHVIDVPTWLGRIDVVETPKFLQPVSPGASMNSPRLFAPETGGFYYITPPKSLAEAAATLDANEDFDRDRILSTAAHEVMPGHFLQLSTARRHPDFVRRIQYSGSFAEGWAFYGEEMFVALGLYGDDLDARYYTAQWERVRGARAIVDAKLASGEMSEAQAAAYFSAQTGFTPAAAKAAIDGIAISPGYVISYTVGRQQLELLEHQYFSSAGARASLDDFHDRLLCYGTTPLSIVGPELIADLAKSRATVQAAAGALP